jgi:hypothetical protein
VVAPLRRYPLVGVEQQRSSRCDGGEQVALGVVVSGSAQCWVLRGDEVERAGRQGRLQQTGAQPLHRRPVLLGVQNGAIPRDAGHVNCG